MDQTKVDFDNYTDNYNSLLRESTAFFSSREIYFAKYKVDILQSLVKRDSRRLLEYGCGIGRNIPFLQEGFPTATIEGSDISAASIEYARTTNPGVEFFVEKDSPASRESYDVVFVAGVFHHIPRSERMDVMKKIFERLTVGGSLVVFEHNPFNPVTRRIVNNCPFDEDAVLLKPRELAGLMRGASFTVDRRGYCLFVPPSLPELLPLEAALSWFPLGGQYWIKATKGA